jgi:hypothetical protein
MSGTSIATVTPKLIRGLAALAVAFAAFLAASTPARAETVTIPIPQAAVIGALNTVFAGMSVHLDAYGSKHTSGRYLSWLDEQSYVRLAGVGQYDFSLGEIDRKTTKTRRLRAYVNDIDMTAAAASMSGGNIRLAAMFESGGYEVKIKCLRYRVLKRDWKDECVIPSIAGKGLDIDNALLTATLKPIAHKGSISFSAVSTDFSANIQAHGLCNVLDGLCDRITNYKAEIRNNVEKLTYDMLARADLRDMVGQQVRTTLESAGLLKPDWNITAVAANGSNFDITVERPDQIDGSSVKIVGFAPKSANLSYTCPLNVGFDASVWSKYSLTGRAWLENENGTTTPKLEWTIGKGQTATSTIARAFNGTKGQTYANRWSRLVVEWKDQKGTVYTAKSGKGYFTVHCSTSSGSFSF